MSIMWLPAWKINRSYSNQLISCMCWTQIIIVFTAAHQFCSQSWTRHTQLTASHSISLRPILILSSQLCLGIENTKSFPSTPWRHKWGNRDTPPLYRNLGPGHFTHGKEPPVSVKQEAGWSPEPVWTFSGRQKSLVSVRNGSLDHPAHSLVATQVQFITAHHFCL